MIPDLLVEDLVAVGSPQVDLHFSRTSRGHLRQLYQPKEGDTSNEGDAQVFRNDTKGHALHWAPYHEVLYEESMVLDVIPISFHRFPWRVFVDECLYEIGYRQRQECGLHKDIESNLSYYNSHAGASSKDSWVQTIVQVFLSNSLIQGTIDGEGEVALEIGLLSGCITIRLCLLLGYQVGGAGLHSTGNSTSSVRRRLKQGIKRCECWYIL